MKSIITKYLTNNASISEIEALENWLKIKENEKIFEDYIKVNFDSNQLKKLPNITKNKKILLEKTQEKKSLFSLPPLKSIYKYAAIFVGLLCIGIYFYKQKPEKNINTQISVSNQLSITEEKVVLKKENGEVLVMEETVNNNLIHNTKGEQVAQQTGSQIKYNQNNSVNNELVYNEVIIPYGKRFEITLSDGTKVELNAGSTFKFPVNFIPGKERKVFLKGEGFFEVAENKKDAFIINSDELNIKVLGTKFNVSSYEEDEEINTVLVAGSVQLYNPKNENTLTTLVPGQKGAWDKTEKNIATEKVDVNLYTAWRSGRLILRNTPFKIIRKKLERYYNISIINKNLVLDEQRYNVNFDNETIEQVLKTINENFNIEYTITNNKIIIN